MPKLNGAPVCATTVNPETGLPFENNDYFFDHITYGCEIPILDQEVAPREEGGERHLDRVALADQDLGDVFLEPGCEIVHVFRSSVFPPPWALPEAVGGLT